MAESKVEKGGSNGRPLHEFALVVTLLFEQFFVDYKVTLSWSCQGSNYPVTKAWSLCFHSALPGTR